MWKEILSVGVGIAVGTALCYGGYKLYVFYYNKNKEKNARELDDLISKQSYVEMLTSKELTAWFRDKRSQFGKNVKMVIAIPTEDNLKGIGYMNSGEIDVDINIIQFLYNNEDGKVLKVRLINYANIDSNLQALLIEHNGMIIVTD